MRRARSSRTSNPSPDLTLTLTLTLALPLTLALTLALILTLTPTLATHPTLTLLLTLPLPLNKVVPHARRTPSGHTDVLLPLDPDALHGGEHDKEGVSVRHSNLKPGTPRICSSADRLIPFCWPLRSARSAVWGAPRRPTLACWRCSTAPRWRAMSTPRPVWSASMNTAQPADRPRRAGAWGSSQSVSQSASQPEA